MKTTKYPIQRKRSKQPADVVLNMTAAALKTGQRPEAIQAAKNAGCQAFKANGRIHCNDLVAWLDAHPEVTEGLADMPDARREKALLLQTERRNAEVDLAKTLRHLVSLDEVTAPLIGLGKTIVSRMLLIPVRMGAKYGAAIQEDMTEEIRKALKVVSETNIKELIEEVRNGNGGN